MIISEEEKRNTAYHEAGHALVAYFHPDSDPLHKVTIIPRGLALGLTMQLPIDDRHTFSREYLHGRIAVAMGGRIAEEAFLHTRTTGAGNDLEVATELARKMVCEWGMSENLGPLTFGRKEEAIFLGREIAQHKDYSESTAIHIDREVKRIVTECYEAAQKIILGNRESLERIATVLLEREVLDGAEIAKLVKGEELPPMKEPTPPAPEKSSATKKPTGEKVRRASDDAAGPLPEPIKT